jgi:hypothetical protein
VTFGETDLATLAAVEEIEIETHSADGDAHRTIIWPLVRDGAVLIRSYRGPGARWYREALADPSVVLHVDGRSLVGRAIPAHDEATIKACSAALREKYRGDPSLGVMLRREVLDTTLRVEPARTVQG